MHLPGKLGQIGGKKMIYKSDDNNNDKASFPFIIKIIDCILHKCISTKNTYWGGPKISTKFLKP